MAISSTILNGTIHGKTIELDESPGFPDGQKVTVRMEPARLADETKPNTLEALKRAAGSWSDDPDGLEQFLEWNRQQRQIRRPELPE